MARLFRSPDLTLAYATTRTGRLTRVTFSFLKPDVSGFLNPLPTLRRTSALVTTDNRDGPHDRCTSIRELVGSLGISALTTQVSPISSVRDSFFRLDRIGIEIHVLALIGNASCISDLAGRCLN